MPDKFIKLGQEEIDKKKSNTNEAIKRKPSGLRRHIGIKRLPDKVEIKDSKSSQPTLPVINALKMNANLDGKAKNNAESIFRSKVEINLDQSMSKSIEEALFYQPLKISHPNNKEPVTIKSDAASLVINEDCSDSSILKFSTSAQSEISSTCSNDVRDDISIVSSAIAKFKSKNSKPLKLSDSSNVQSPFKFISLKDFQIPHKTIDVQNRQKKEMLYKTIHHKSKGPAIEAHRIKEIEKQVIKLDDDFTMDVALLKKKIDRVCLYFTTIEQQYMKTEKVFEKAEVNLHKTAKK